MGISRGLWYTGIKEYKWKDSEEVFCHMWNLVNRYQVFSRGLRKIGTFKEFPKRF
jgi:hypothetical protein